jgi:hypothetical protein
MKILLLGTPRSGSTSLVKFIDSHIKLPNYKMFIEPFNQTLYPNKKYDKDRDTIVYLTKVQNILVKNLFLVGNDEYPKESFNNIYEYLEWCYSYFDKIIILDRKDKVAQSESFTINETMFREKGIGWHTQKIYDLSKVEASYIRTMIDRYTKSSEILEKISHEKSYPVFYYEDIFINYNVEILKELMEYIDMELDMKIYSEYVLSPYRKVRLDNQIKHLI